MGKISSFIVFIIFFLFSSAIAQEDCSLVIEPDVLIIDGNNLDYQPGSTICLKGGNKEYLLIQNIHGTADQPVTIVNHQGQVIIDTDHYFGIKIAHCSFLKFSGTGTEGVPYGFFIKKVSQGAGLSVGDLSTDIEVENVEISHTAIGGVYAKTDPSCNDFSSTRDKFTMYNFIMHDCYIHDIPDEGFYIGSSKYTGQTLYDCDTVVLPHVLIGTKIYNNLVENTGWDGIQVSSAEYDCEVHDNVVLNNSTSATPGQMSGILIGGGSRCKVYNNKIMDGKGDGIDLFGLGSQMVFNNLLVRNGKTFNPNDANDHKHGIYLGMVQGATAPNEWNYLFNNTIVSPKSFGITYHNEESKAKIFNNVILDPGYTPAQQNAFINIMTNNDFISSENNFTSFNIYDARFISVSDDNYDLQVISPLIDQASDISDFSVDFDIENRDRPFHQHYDLGAYECQSPYINIGETTDETDIFLYPNPSDQWVKLKTSQKLSDLSVTLFDLLGNPVMIKRGNLQQSGKLQINTGSLDEGHYILVLKNKETVLKTMPLVIKHHE